MLQFSPYFCIHCLTEHETADEYQRCQRDHGSWAGASVAPQKRRHSLLESLLNTASGFCLSYICGLIVFPLFGFAVGHGQNAAIVGIFTGLSIGRNYIWRRTFNWWQHHAKH